MKNTWKSSGLETCTRRKAIRKMAVGTVLATLAPFTAFSKKPSYQDGYWGKGVRPDVYWYVRRFYDSAEELWKAHHLPVWGTLAVALLESAVGESDLAIGGNNHFGIKAHRDKWPGTIYYKETGRGPNNEVYCDFYRAYPSVEAGYRDFGKFLQRSRYDALRRCGPYDFRRWCYAIKEAGYAVDQEYAVKLITRIRDHKLNELNYRRPEPLKRV